MLHNEFIIYTFLPDIIIILYLDNSLIILVNNDMFLLSLVKLNFR